LNNITIAGDRFSGAEGDSKSLMINATQMCKAAGKKWNDYFRIELTQPIYML
jgi:hypothetical protein